MDEYVDLSADPGHLDQGLTALAGVAWVIVVVCHTIPGLTLILLIPALILCLYPLVVTPHYGHCIGEGEWRLLLGGRQRRVALDQIDHLKVTLDANRHAAALVLRDGTALTFPDDLSVDPLRMIREATRRGIAVRLG